MSTKEKQSEILQAAGNMDWMQVVLNQGPPCFHLDDDGYFCGRAMRWEGHRDHGEFKAFHDYVSLKDLLQSVMPAQHTGGEEG